VTKILLVEDDERIIGFLKRGLEAEGHVVDVAGDGAVAMHHSADYDYPLVILDRMLPDMDGLEFCRELRSRGRQSLILMLTARDSVEDRIDGLLGGADDYLTKPFAFDELLARITALARRAPYSEPPRVLTVGDLSLDPSTRQVHRADEPIALTAKEFALLQFFMAHPGTVLSRSRILSNVWEQNSDPYTNIVDVYVRYLRAKIDPAGEPTRIRTVRGVGYVMSP
jgi:two-component system, OmpR family, response regulator